MVCIVLLCSKTTIFKITRTEIISYYILHVHAYNSVWRSSVWGRRFKERRAGHKHLGVQRRTAWCGGGGGGGGGT